MKLKCENCEFACIISTNNPYQVIDELLERVEPGETMPWGQCPDCRALLHEDDEITAESRDLVDAFTQGSKDLIDQGGILEVGMTWEDLYKNEAYDMGANFAALILRRKERKENG